MKYRSLTVASLLLASLCCFASQSAADTFQDILASDEMKKVVHLTTKPGGKKETNRWAKPGTNYWKIFYSTDGPPSLVTTWIGTITSAYTPGSPSVQTREEFIKAERPYVTKGGKRITLAVYVPHPKFIPMVQFGLIGQLVDLEPPRLEVVSAEQVDIRGNPARLFRQKNGSCSLLLKLPKAAVVNLSTHSCAQVGDLITLGEMLDISRLSRKLNT